MIEPLVIAKVAPHKEVPHYSEPVTGRRFQRLITKASGTKCILFLDSSGLESDQKFECDLEGGHMHDHEELLM